MRLARNLSAVFVLALAATAAAQEKAVNPEFTGWSKFKPGTTITLKISTTINGKTSDSISTQTLIEVAKDKVVIQKKHTHTFMGKVMEAPPAKFDIPAKSELSPLGNETAEDRALMKPKDTVEEGTEKVKIGKDEVATKWYLAKGKSITGLVHETKIWTSPDVPGMLVKKVTTTTEGKMPPVTTTFEVISITKK